MNENKIYLDQQGYQELLKSIDMIKLKIKENSAGRKEAFDAGAGDGWDSPEFEEIERQERLLNGELAHLYDTLTRVEIIEKEDNAEIIDIGDVFKIDIYFSSDDFEEDVFKLVGGSADFNKEIKEISLNSPLGKSVYKKKVGDTTSYNVGDRQFNVLIKSKLDLTLNDEDCLQQKKTR